LGKASAALLPWLRPWKPVKRSQRECSPAAGGTGQSVALLQVVCWIAFRCCLQSRFRGRLAARFCFSEPRTPAVHPLAATAAARPQAAGFRKTRIRGAGTALPPALPSFGRLVVSGFGRESIIRSMIFGTCEGKLVSDEA